LLIIKELPYRGVNVQKAKLCGENLGDTKLTQKLYELFTSRKYDELFGYCSIILSKDPVNLTALKYKAYSLFFLEKFEDSIACYDRAIQIEPDNPSHYAGKSKALDKLGRFEESRDCYEQAKKLKDKKSDLGHNKNEWGT